MIWLISILVFFLAALAVPYAMYRRRFMDRWLREYLRQRKRRALPLPAGPRHLLLCIADHFEPHNGGVADARASERVARWAAEYPRVLGEFHDSDGRSPRHTFFYPIEQYDADHVEAIAGLCRKGFGEVEIHLHHDRDNAENLRRRLLAGREILAGRHGLLARHRTTGRIMYGFVHGDWALCNSRPDGRCCGVNNELEILNQTGCYADFTMPSAPDPAQTRKINSIYYAVGGPPETRPLDHGVDLGTAPAPGGGIMLIQGPLLLNWRHRSCGLAPRIENGCIQSNQPPTMERLDLWLKARVQAPSRPDWFFVKLHTHGAPEASQAVLLGQPMVRFHQALARRAAGDPSFHYHYLTAREMYNFARAAEACYAGPVAEARDFELGWNGC